MPSLPEDIRFEQICGRPSLEILQALSQIRLVHARPRAALGPIECCAGVIESLGVLACMQLVVPGTYDGVRKPLCQHQALQVTLVLQRSGTLRAGVAIALADADALSRALTGPIMTPYNLATCLETEYVMPLYQP